MVDYPGIKPNLVSDIVVPCNDPRKRASHICAIPQKDLSSHN